MKNIKTNKVVIALMVLMTCFSFANAQAFKKGDVMLSPGIGLGVYGVGFGLGGFALPVVLNADFGVHDYVSVGAYGGFWTRKWNGFAGNGDRLSSIHVGARASFHFWQLIDAKVDADLAGDKLDIYLTPWLGYNIRTGSGGFGVFGFGNRFQGGAQLGARYFVNDHIGFFGEWGGTPTAYSNFGMTFKF